MGLSRYAAKRMSSTVVTEPYRAPELFSTRCITEYKEYTCTIDIWSLGVMIVDAVEATPTFISRTTPEEFSTHQIIWKTLCFEEHGDNLGLSTVMPNVMGCKPVKRVVFKRKTDSRLACY